MSKTGSTRKLRGTAKKKAELKEILGNCDWEKVDEWHKKKSNLITILLGLLLDEDEEIKWRAIESIGRISRQQNEADNKNSVQETIKRLFWQMNEDCAGGIEAAPLALAEILFNVPSFIRTYGAGLLNYLMTPPFEQGVSYAAQRLAPLSAPLIQYKQMWFEGLLIHDDPLRRAYAAKALLIAGFDIPNARKESFRKDENTFKEYIHGSGKITEITVKQSLNDLI